MMSHLGMMILFALSVAVVFATLLRDEPREQVRVGLKIFGALVVAAFVVGWGMFAFFG